MVNRRDGKGVGYLESIEGFKNVLLATYLINIID